MTSNEELVGDAARAREEQGARVRGIPRGGQAAGGLTQRLHGHGRAYLPWTNDGLRGESWRRRRARGWELGALAHGGT